MTTENAYKADGATIPPQPVSGDGSRVARVHIKESARFYWKDGRVAYGVPSADGKKEVAPDIRHAKKFGLLYGVTSIIKVRANFSLQNWKRSQDILSALTATRREGESDESLVARVIEDAEAHAKQAADRGKVIHAAVDGWFMDVKESEDPVAKRVCHQISDYLGAKGDYAVSCEASFARPDLGYAGTPDMVATYAGDQRYVLDLKTTDLSKFKAPYVEWKMQLAAYRQALDIPQAQLVQVVADRTTGECKFIVHEDSHRWEQAYNHLFNHEACVSGYDPRLL